MSVIQKAFKAGIWLAAFKAVSQSFSWVATIIVARILVPEDYGLMAMATILTGYVVLFSELGLGAAIIQRGKPTNEELSSLFWLVVCWGCFLSIVCILLSYPTVAIFKEPRILRVTQSAAVLYILGAFLIVPRNILERALRFKAIGFIEAVATMISCSLMIVIAALGGGVWTLIGGLIIQKAVTVILSFFVLSWRPTIHFDFVEIKPFLHFGLNLAGAGTLHYIYMNSDKFFAGRILGSIILGYYSFALQLARIPADKIIVFMNRVSFPVFSRYQGEKREFNKFFLKLVKLVAFISFPLYIGGAFVADQLIPLVLGTKWMPIILPFKFLCISQLIGSVFLTNAVVLNAKGLPHWNLYLATANVLILPASFYIAARHGLIFMAIPWLVIEPVIRLGHTLATLKLMTISISDYLKTFIQPILATCTMLCVLTLVKFGYLNILNLSNNFLKSYVALLIVSGAVSYAGYIMVFSRSTVTGIIRLARGKY
ncbi:MAG: lipopolysaccharide biosynthesis protein [Thermodesulfobacteriota bacterium]|nr:lipopolysaccharide biosynthesis protein [Thermodesulfobacteriota bacterium]